MRVTTKEAMRRARVDSHVAKLAYAYVRELVHPIPDGTMVRRTQEDLMNAIGNLPYEDRVRLSEMWE